MRSAHYVEVYPTEPHRFQLRLDVPPPTIIFRQRGRHLLGWKYPMVGFGGDGNLTPLLDSPKQTIGQRRPSYGEVRLGRIHDAAIDTLLHVGVLAFQTAPR